MGSWNQGIQIRQSGKRRLEDDDEARILNGGLDSKASVYNVGDPGSIPRLGRSPGEGNGNPLQHSCLGNSMDRGAWEGIVHGVAKSRTRLRDFTFTFTGRAKSIVKLVRGSP